MATSYILHLGLTGHTFCDPKKKKTNSSADDCRPTYAPSNIYIYIFGVVSVIFWVISDGDSRHYFCIFLYVYAVKKKKTRTLLEWQNGGSSLLSPKEARSFACASRGRCFVHRQHPASGYGAQTGYEKMSLSNAFGGRSASTRHSTFFDPHSQQQHTSLLVSIRQSSPPTATPKVAASCVPSR